MTTDTRTTRTARKWTKGLDAWREFCENDGAALRFKGNQNSWKLFYRKHGKTLEANDIARRSPAHRTVVVDVERFGAVAFDLVTTGTLPDEVTTAAAA